MDWKRRYRWALEHPTTPETYDKLMVDKTNPGARVVAAYCCHGRVWGEEGPVLSLRQIWNGAGLSAGECEAAVGALVTTGALVEDDGCGWDTHPDLPEDPRFARSPVVMVPPVDLYGQPAKHGSFRSAGQPTNTQAKLF